MQPSSGHANKHRWGRESFKDLGVPSAKSQKDQLAHHPSCDMHSEVVRCCSLVTSITGGGRARRGHGPLAPFPVVRTEVFTASDPGRSPVR
jgi:hypothetical protein